MVDSGNLSASEKDYLDVETAEFKEENEKDLQNPTYELSGEELCELSKNYIPCLGIVYLRDLGEFLEKMASTNRHELSLENTSVLYVLSLPHNSPNGVVPHWISIYFVGSLPLFFSDSFGRTWSQLFSFYGVPLPDHEALENVCGWYQAMTSITCGYYCLLATAFTVRSNYDGDFVKHYFDGLFEDMSVLGAQPTSPQTLADVAVNNDKTCVELFKQLY